jgi:hypothetical protein
MVYTQVLRMPVQAAKLLTEMTLFVVSWLVQSLWLFQGNEQAGRREEQT